VTDERLVAIEAKVACLQRNQRRLLWLLAAVGVVRLLLIVEGWALGMSQDQMMQQAAALLMGGRG
jgi:superfamily II RNA helicase